MTDLSLRRAVLTVALLNLAWFGVEFGVAINIQSVSLFADSIDFLEDASVNLLILLALGWSRAARARAGMAMAALLMVPGLATLWALWQQIASGVAPEATSLTLTGLGALAINSGCALLLTRFRDHSGSLTRAAFLSARNDAYANLAIIGAGLVTLLWPQPWPDVIVGIGIALLNADAARDVWHAARREQRDAAS